MQWWKYWQNKWKNVFGIQPSAKFFIIFGFSQEFSFRCIPKNYAILRGKGTWWKVRRNLETLWKQKILNRQKMQYINFPCKKCYQWQHWLRTTIYSAGKNSFRAHCDKFPSILIEINKPLSSVGSVWHTTTDNRWPSKPNIISVHHN